MRMQSAVVIVFFLAYFTTAQSLRCYECSNCATVQPNQARTCNATAACCGTTKTETRSNTIVERYCSTHCGGSFTSNRYVMVRSWGCKDSPLCNDVILDGSANRKCYQCKDCGPGAPRQEDLKDCPSGLVCCHVDVTRKNGKTTIDRGCSALCADMNLDLFGYQSVIKSCTRNGCNTLTPALD